MTLRPIGLDPVLQRLDADRAAAVDRLRDLLRIPSVSTDPAYRDHIHAAAAWIRDHLNASGLTAQVMPTQGHPVVFAQTPASAAPPGGPTVLFYGHYDVQPPDPLDQWQTPPFDPIIRDLAGPDAHRGQALFARGACDDKGQVMCFLEALRAWSTSASARGRAIFPCHIKVLIEGEEEMGSIHLPAFIEQHRDLLAADFVLISDTSMWEPVEGQPRPAITYALRGLVYFDIQLHGPSRDLHSGVYGGAVPNPAVILPQILAKLFDDQHRVTIPGFYDDVAPLTESERLQWSALGFDEADFLRSIGLSAPFGEADFSTLQRRWGRPACDINGLYGGYMGHGAKTVIPSFAGAKVSFRLAAHQNGEKIAAAFQRWLHAQNTHSLTWKITPLGAADPVATPTDSPYVAAATRAVRRVFDQEVALIRDGATIPIVASFKKILNRDSLLLGFGRPNDRLHSPNEKFDLQCYHQGCATHAALLAELGQLAST
jgi:acetylornithine deacetylase/succinyl-diaminopimelate desuccinylase-like protein